MKTYLLPAALLVLAITQVPGMIQATRVNQCFDDLGRVYREELNRKADAFWRTSYCNGGTGHRPGYF